MFKKINGNAGSGKTHRLISDIEEFYNPDLEIWQQPFILITPTNKAAMVLNSRLVARGLPKLAKTLHSTLYQWRPTDEIKTIKKVRTIDPDTLKYKVDEAGQPVYHEEYEYVMERTIKESIEGKIVFVDESSMVSSEVWYDLLNCGLVNQIYAYGDEKQLPPVEDINKLDWEIKPYYRFWHSYTDEVETLSKNHRQQGSLKNIVDCIQTSLFSGKYSKDIPSGLIEGDNFTVHNTDLTESDLLAEMIRADIIITPYNKIRTLSNIICRRFIAKTKNQRFDQLPVVGDKIIFVDAIKKENIINGRTIKEIYLPKNITAVITEIHDKSIIDNEMIISFTDETGVEHEHIRVSLNTITGLTTTPGPARIDYAYAVTVHSSQGGAWDNVLFLNGHWPGEDSNKMRYVGITRAQKSLAVINGITNSTESKDANKSIMIRLGQLLAK
jgi:hypothetical protein